MKKRKKKKTKKKFIKKNRRQWTMPTLSLPHIGKPVWIAFGAIFLLTLLLAAILYFGKVEKTTVEGNAHYTSEEIISMVMEKEWEKNSLYLFFKYRGKSIKGIPFVDKMTVTIQSPHAIHIRVYEKVIAGYVEYLGNYIYFDKDGVVVESSKVKTANVPEIAGLKFDNVTLYQVLPIEDPSLFQSILDISQLLEKYGIQASKIYFDSKLDMTFFFQNVRVKFGDQENIDDKILRLKNILPELDGKKGVLHLENYQKGTKNIVFEMDEEFGKEEEEMSQE